MKCPCGGQLCLIEVHQFDINPDGTIGPRPEIDKFEYSASLVSHYVECGDCEHAYGFSMTNGQICIQELEE